MTTSQRSFSFAPECVPWLDVLVCAPLGVLIVFMGLYGTAAADWWAKPLMLVIAIGGVASVLSCFYAVIGRCDVVREDDGWLVTYRLGESRWRRRTFVASTDMRRVSCGFVGSYQNPFPGTKGRQVFIERRSTKRRLAIGGGFGLEREAFTELVDALQADIDAHDTGYFRGW